MAKIKLGDVVKDRVTGFQGVAVAITTWLNGCDRVGVQPTKLDKEGKPRDTVTFDVLQLELVKACKHEPVAETGGPRDEVVRGARTPGRR